jgi:hypothetical protein
MTTETINIAGWIVFVHRLEDSDKQLLVEAKTKGTPLTGTYSYIKHQPHNPTGEYHLHVYNRGNEILSINQSGRGHDGYSGTWIPNEVFTALKSKFPTWNFPDSQLIEGVTYTEQQITRAPLRPVSVFGPNGYSGYFHAFAHEVMQFGGGVQPKQHTWALIEDEDGRMHKVSVDNFRFTDIGK